MSGLFDCYKVEARHALSLQVNQKGQTLRLAFFSSSNHVSRFIS